MKRTLTTQEWADLQGSGHVVDHADRYYTPGKEYTVTDGKATARVKCTQSHPPHLILIK